MRVRPPLSLSLSRYRRPLIIWSHANSRALGPPWPRSINFLPDANEHENGMAMLLRRSTKPEYYLSRVALLRPPFKIIGCHKLRRLHQSASASLGARPESDPTKATPRARARSARSARVQISRSRRRAGPDIGAVCEWPARWPVHSAGLRAARITVRGAPITSGPRSRTGRRRALGGELAGRRLLKRIQDGQKSSMSSRRSSRKLR